MDPITILAIVAAALATMTVVCVIYLKWNDIVDWFKGISTVSKNRSYLIGWTILENLANGKYKVIRGVINTKTKELVEGQVMEVKKIDKPIEDAHRGKKVVIYNHI